ncbi:MAG: amidohydrolase family protein [Fimbriimonadaceae bacterium]|jgi:N-acetylglucosamine-6-phosphate deacetylase|nr:amidohydrolase family protein [Fimbriimonadaceae bacterium]
MKEVFYGFGHEGYRPYEGILCDSKTWQPSARTPIIAAIPGFIDLHIHGAFGIDFMAGDLAQNQLMVDKLRAEGYEGLLLTTITAPLDSVRRALASLPIDPLVLGFHLEGPFISPVYPGAQPPEAILQPDKHAEEWEEVWQDPRLKRITLAPELPGSVDLARRLSARGVQVSMGHTNATYDEAMEGIEAGFAHATHTFNAMKPFHHREAGTVGAVLTHPEICAELIYDRIHVSPYSARLVIQTKAPDHLVAVSDCTRAKGLPPGTKLDMWGHEGEVFEDSVRLSSNGALAGSVSSLKDVFLNLATDFGVGLAIQVCCINPGRICGIYPRIRSILHLNTRSFEPIPC